MTNAILAFGNETQKNDYIPKLASGEHLGAFALTESGAGSDAASIKTTNHFIINGSKVFITSGSHADVLIVFARTSEVQDSKGISAFIVDKDSPGLLIGKKEKKMGLSGAHTVELSFDKCIVQADQMLGKEGEGFKIAMANLNVGRIGIAAQALGIGEAALEHAISYAKEREQFGKHIAEQQGILFKLADLGTQIEAAKLLTYHAASLVQNGVPCGKEASMAKVFSSKVAVQTAIEAVQVYGGYGYTKDYPVERFFRDVKVTEIYEGTSEIQKMVIAKHLLK